MATENRAVTVYLPPDIEQSVIEFCKEYGFTRKDKTTGEVLPVLGTGIVEYLKSAISGAFPITRNVPTNSGNGLNRDEVLDLIGEYITSNSSDTVPSNVPSNGLTRDEVLELIGGLSIPTNEDLDRLKGEIERLERQLNEGISNDIRANPSADRDGLDRLSTIELNKFKDDPKFLAAVRDSNDKCGNSKEICQMLLEAGYGSKGNTKPYDVGYVARWRNAIEVIDRETNSANLG